MENQISINDLIRMFLKRWWIILLCGVLFACSAFAYTNLFVTPLYTSSGSLYVNNKDQNNVNKLTTNDVLISQQLVNTYSQVLKSKTFSQNIAQKIGNGLSASAVQSMVSMGGVDETGILQISASSPHPELSRAIVQEILNDAPAEIMRVVKAGSVEVIDNASLPTAPSSPNVKTNTLLGFLIGVVLAAGIIFVIELLDTRIKNEDMLFEKFEIPVLGVIPDFTQE